ncbi:protein DpdE [Actinocorallia aurantiaca]
MKARTEALRAHISEGYRLHRRVIRHRRSRVTMDDPDAVYIPYEVRGRQKPEALVTASGQHEISQTRLMDWRSATWDHLLDHGLEEAKVAYGRVLGILASRANGWVNDLTDALSWRVEREDGAAVRAGLSAYERVLLTEAPVLNVERELLAEWRAEEQADEGESINAVVSSLLPALKTSTRTVIFCGPGMLAGVVAERMSKRFQKVAVHEHSHRVGPQESEHSLVLWASESMPRVHVLVTDDSAEEGLNLQLADTIIHLRLPWSPNDLEQRLGRVDRYPGATGQREAARQYRLASEESDSYSEAWAVLLERGYDLFTESVSTLQDAIAGGLDRVWTAGYESGAEGLHGIAGEVRDSLREARLDIDKMDLLESIHETSIAGRNVASSLLEMETFWRDVHKTLVGYVDINGGIGLAFHERTVGKSPAVAFDLSASTPKIDPRLWKRARPELTTAAQGAFNRNVALRHPGTRLLRVGNPLIDVLAEAVYLDDRGQATAFRRVDQRYRGDAHAHFGFHYLVEADLTDALLLLEGNADASRALRRQADRLLTPFTMKVWVNTSTELPIIEPGILSWLEQPYNNRSDQNYNARFLDELLDVFNGWDGYRSSGNSCEQIARDHLLKTKELSERCQRAQDEARQRVAVTVAQARTRQLAGHLVGDTESLLTDVDITQALIERLTQPTVKVVAATCVVRAGLRSAAR